MVTKTTTGKTAAAKGNGAKTVNGNGGKEVAPFDHRSGGNGRPAQTLAEVLAVREGLSQTKARSVLGTIAEEIGARLAMGGRVALNDLGSFTVQPRAPRMARNPRTGQVIAIPATKRVKFAPASALKSRVATDAPDASPAFAGAGSPA